MNILDKLNAVSIDYYVVQFGIRSFKIFSLYNKCYGVIMHNVMGEKGAYIDLDKLITDLSLEELQVITKMVQIVDKYEKEVN